MKELKKDIINREKPNLSQELTGIAQIKYKNKLKNSKGKTLYDKSTFSNNFLFNIKRIKLYKRLKRVPLMTK